VVVDSTGLKIFGEGEWKVRQHGVGKRRTWRKIHLAVDESTKDIIGIEVTTAEWGDSEILPGLLDQVEGEIDQVSNGVLVPPFPRAKAPLPGETIIPVMQSSRRSTPRERASGRTRAATTGAASRKT
jgi:hypothetical protein